MKMKTEKLQPKIIRKYLVERRKWLIVQINHFAIFFGFTYLLWMSIKQLKAEKNWCMYNNSSSMVKCNSSIGSFLSFYMYYIYISLLLLHQQMFGDRWRLNSLLNWLIEEGQKHGQRRKDSHYHLYYNFVFD